MSLTRQALLDKIKPRTETVEIDGFGAVIFKSRSNLKTSTRQLTYCDDNGVPIDDELVKVAVHDLIDQVYVNEKTPMFTDDDVETLLDADAKALEPLMDALAEFNGQKKSGATSKTT